MRESRFIIVSIILHGILFGSMLINWKFKQKQEYMDSNVLLVGQNTGTKINPPKQKEKAPVKPKMPVDENAPKVFDPKAAADSDNETQGTFGQGGTKPLDYETELNAWLAVNKHYPKLARRLGQECENIVVTFTLHPDGKITDVAVKEKCQYDILNQAAVDQVKAASPFKPFPANFPQTAMHREVPFSYKLGE